MDKLRDIVQAVIVVVGVIVLAIALAYLVFGRAVPTITKVAGEQTDVCSDLPRGWQSFVVHQRNGYAWLVIEDPNGNFDVVPYLNADGSQNQAEFN